MKDQKENNKEVGLGALFYPTSDTFGKEVPFESLFIPYIYKEIEFEGVYIDILNQQKDMVIMDVGANIGITVDHFRKHAKKVYALEPSPEHFAALAKNKEFNHWDNVELFEVALSDRVGETTLAQNDGNRTMNSIMVDNPRPDGSGPRSSQYVNRVTVKTIDFETFFKENNIDKVDFVKFDVEAADDLILRSEGFKNVADKIQAIEVEFHYPDWMDLVEYLRSLGFTPRRYEASAIIVLFSR